MDYAIKEKQAIIASTDTPSIREAGRIAQKRRDANRLQARNQSKLVAAINHLGQKWVLHPYYNECEHPHHSIKHKHSAILAPVMRDASQAGRI